MKILFLHGWQSVPGGVKPTYLNQNGCEVINPSLDNDDFDLAIQTAQAEFDLHKPDCVVGSSRGGAVALNIQSGSTPLVLLCPAWKKWGGIKKLKQQSAVLHSPMDEVIPFEDSEELISRSGLSPEVLIEVGNDHRLADESSLAVLLWACRQLSSKDGLLRLEVESHLAESSGSILNAAVQGESNYICDACGEQIVIPLDLTEGGSQVYVEDCPVCCRANVIHVELDENGDAQVWAEPE